MSTELVMVYSGDGACDTDVIMVVVMGLMVGVMTLVASDMR